MKKIIQTCLLGVLLPFLHCNNAWGQKNNDLEMVMMSDEGAAYTLISYSLQHLEVRDSILIFSPYSFNGKNLFPPLWDTVILPSQNDYLSIQSKYKYIGQVEILEKTDSVVIQRFLVYKKNSFSLELILNQGLQTLRLDENSSEGHFLGSLFKPEE